MYCYTTRDIHRYLRLQVKMHSKMTVQQVWHFMHRISQVQQRAMLYLSLTIESVGHCIRYANIKAFSGQTFPCMDITMDIYGEICIRETLYICIFYTVRRISLANPETYTSHNKNNRH